jgi:tetratricopeptide (TPR) repeat protein
MATLVAYEPIRHNGFINYDDDKYVTENPNVSGGITRSSVIWAFTNPHQYMWHPLTTLSHIIDCQFFGLKPLGHHLVSVFLHVANVLLLFWILTNLTGSIWASAFVAAVFALHPLQVGPVAWVAERKTVMSGLFWFLTIAVYIWYAKKPGIGRYILVFAIYALCIMTKPVVVTVPLTLLLLDYWPLERIGRRKTEDPSSLRFAEAGRGQQKVSPGWLIVEKIPLLVLSALSSVMTVIAQHSGGAIVSLEIMPLDYRVANMFISYITYIGKMIAPSRLAVLYPHLSIIIIAVAIFYVLLFVLVSAISIYIGRRRKYAVVSWLWYVGTLVPMIGLVQVGSQAMADRYMYISILGLLIIVAWGTRDLVANRPRLRVIAAVLAVTALSSAIILTRIQVGYWKNSLILFEHTLKVTENNSTGENCYAGALSEAGRADEAIVHLSNAVRITPTFFEARINLGKAFLRQKKFKEAIECFNKALQTSPDQIYFQTEIYVNLAVAYTKLGNYELAIKNRNKAMELKSDAPPVLNDLAWLLATAGDASVQDANRAVEFARRACELTGYKKPDFMDTLAAAYAAAGRFEDAVNTAKQAIDAAKAGNQNDLAKQIQSHMKLYQAGQPYREK